MMKTFINFLFILSIVALVFTACQEAVDDDIRSSSSNIFDIEFSVFPPKDLEENASDTSLIKFAWEEFLALNWKSSYNQNGLRDFPDTTWNWSSDNDPYPDLVVWETYAHRTELRPAIDKILPFDSVPHYSYDSTLYPVTLPNGTKASFTLFNNLDENNEIGSCNVYAHVNKYNKEIMVLYQAKVNRDEYQYISKNYSSNLKLRAALDNTKYNIKTYKAYYNGATNTCNCPSDSVVVCLPCGGSPIPGGNGETYQGAMEIKTAWRILVPEDDPSKFFKRNVIFYEKKSDGKIYYTNDTLALIGVHIIHKTTNYPDFVFATWEHLDVESDSMGYILLKKENETGPLFSNFPRLHPIPQLVDQSTQEVHQQIKKMNKNSVWLNYRLVGVQGKPTNDSTSFNFFLANYVIESDTALADFHGSGIGMPHDLGKNILLNKQEYSMGGCKGCHGVAQRSGSDFSFLLLSDSFSKPDILESIPKTGRSKLERLIEMTKR